MYPIHLAPLSRTLRFLTAGLVLGTLVAGARAEASCFQPCGSPVSGRAGAPRTSDALYVLRQAVGITKDCELCECDTDHNGSVSTLDALRVLRVAVGANLSLSCPACGSITAAKAFSRGRASLERHDLAFANSQFGCSVEADSTNSPANLFYAMTRVAAFVANNPELQTLLTDTGSEGSADIYKQTITFPNGVDLPTVAKAKPVLLDGLATELGAAIENLKKPIADKTFLTTLTPPMAPKDLYTSQYELDAGDAAVLSAAYRQLRCFLYFSIGAYHASTFDLVRDDPVPACASDFVATHPQFLTVASTAAMATAKTECKGAIDNLITARDLIAAEKDSQSDDLVVLDDIDGDGPQKRTTREVLVALRNSFSQVTNDLPACDELPFPLQLGKLFDSPITRLDLPDTHLGGTNGDVCYVDKESFPDLSFNGLLPSFPTISMLDDINDSTWPTCSFDYARLFFGTNGSGSCTTVIIDVDLAASSSVLAHDTSGKPLCNPGSASFYGCQTIFEETEDGHLRANVFGCTVPSTENFFSCEFESVDVANIGENTAAQCACQSAGDCDSTPPICAHLYYGSPDACEDCYNGYDDDGNGLTDCSDPNCEHNPACNVIVTTTSTTSTSGTTPPSTLAFGDPVLEDEAATCELSDGVCTFEAAP